MMELFNFILIKRLNFCCKVHLVEWSFTHAAVKHYANLRGFNVHSLAKKKNGGTQQIGTSFNQRQHKI